MVACIEEVVFVGGRVCCPPISERKGQILRLLAEGLTNKEIGHKLRISDQTVKNHIRELFMLLDVRSRTELALWAHRSGWLRGST